MNPIITIIICQLFFFLVICNSRSSSSVMAFATTNSNSPADSNMPQKKEEEDASVLRLPEADPNADIPTIQLGESIRFEEMGPVILNSDGSTRRIDNWDEMTEREKEVTWRRIRKRNEERRKKLLQEQETNTNTEEGEL